MTSGRKGIKSRLALFRLNNVGTQWLWQRSNMWYLKYLVWDEMVVLDRSSPFLRYLNVLKLSAHVMNVSNNRNSLLQA